jgi:[acyl-carrier-protein] S-malonyltransferase
MSTAFAFAPLTAFLRPQDRLRYRDLPEVRQRLNTAEAVFRACRGADVCFDDLLQQPTSSHYDPARIDITATLISAVQLGVVDCLQKFYPRPAWVVGCSLGDVARAACAGVCEAETGLRIALQICDLKGADRIGRNIVIMTTARRPFTKDDLAWIASLNLTFSQLTPTVLNASGAFDDVDRLRQDARQKHWRTFHLADFPVHSPHLAAYSDDARQMLKQLPLQPPARGIRVYSSLLKREIICVEDFAEELVRGVTEPHSWPDSVTDLVTHHGVTTFVNIGPCRTLSHALRRMKQPVLEADDLLRTAGVSLASV